MGGILSRISRVPVGAAVALLVAAVIALAVVLLTGGDDKTKIPANAVALVGDQPITSASLTHWQSIYAHAAAASNSKPTAAQARKAAFELLAGFAWVEQEADRQNVNVTKSQLDQAMTALFAQYQGASKQQVLSQMGASEADLRTQQRVALLATALQNKVAKTAKAPSAQQIQAAYDAEPERWAHPSKRDIRVVVTSSSQSAQAAAAALSSGKSFTAVNRQYSNSSSLASSGGAVKNLKPGTSDPALERAVFKAQTGRLVGPIQTPDGWVVFKVQRVTPLADQSLAQATSAIRSELTSTAQGKTVNRYLDSMRSYWHARTHCSSAISDKTYC
jgi:parvulin-like peptidyl-prolyl isomerase